MDAKQEQEALLALAALAAHTARIAQLLQNLNETLTHQLSALNKKADHIAETIIDYSPLVDG